MVLFQVGGCSITHKTVAIVPRILVRRCFPSIFLPRVASGQALVPGVRGDNGDKVLPIKKAGCHGTIGGMLCEFIVQVALLLLRVLQRLLNVPDKASGDIGVLGRSFRKTETLRIAY